ncbi:unnamed protein product [Dovyalis caffra]|uniref:DNA mismatch repair proteins mutS family domain-containing protein n=1 Tax=Dovyalis caffra TaxID=77055 RepID=A0AAV1QRJ1_9ROSI|nr:unnamed protein product [Dovyalis caffra]
MEFNRFIMQDIRSRSTSQSLVLLDEVGAGTNPLEGAALGMSLLESFADSGALLTIATTHHGELKSLKYSNHAFENACMEFDEVNLKPTYKILWGVPGRSNAINISEKLGLPSVVVSNARELYGAASAEINEVIIDMEKFKQDSQQLLYEAQHHLMLSRNLHKKLKLARRKIWEHRTEQRYRKMRQISEAASMARSMLHKKVRQLRAHATQPFRPVTAEKKQLSTSDRRFTAADKNGQSTANMSTSKAYMSDPLEGGILSNEIPTSSSGAISEEILVEFTNDWKRLKADIPKFKKRSALKSVIVINILGIAHLYA